MLSAFIGFFLLTLVFSQRKTFNGSNFESDVANFYANSTIECDDDEDCVVRCSNTATCENTTILCPESDNTCTVYFSEEFSQEEILYSGFQSTIRGGGGHLKVIAYGNYGFNNGTIYCPDNKNCSLRCSLTSMNQTYTTGPCAHTTVRGSMNGNLDVHAETKWSLAYSRFIEMFDMMIVQIFTHTEECIFNSYLNFKGAQELHIRIMNLTENTTMFTTTGVPLETTTGTPRLDNITLVTSTAVPIGNATNATLMTTTGVPLMTTTGVTLETTTGIPLETTTGTPRLDNITLLTTTGIPLETTTGTPRLDNVTLITSTAVPIDNATNFTLITTTGVPIVNRTNVTLETTTGIPLETTTGTPRLDFTLETTTGVPLETTTGTPRLDNITLLTTTGIPLETTTGIPLETTTGVPLETTTGTPRLDNVTLITSTAVPLTNRTTEIISAYIRDSEIYGGNMTYLYTSCYNCLINALDSIWINIKGDNFEKCKLYCPLNTDKYEKNCIINATSGYINFDSIFSIKGTDNLQIFINRDQCYLNESQNAVNDTKNTTQNLNIMPECNATIPLYCVVNSTDSSQDNSNQTKFNAVCEIRYYEDKESYLCTSNKSTNENFTSSCGFYEYYGSSNTTDIGGGKVDNTETITDINDNNNNNMKGLKNKLIIIIPVVIGALICLLCCCYFFVGLINKHNKKKECNKNNTEDSQENYNTNENKKLIPYV